MPESRAVMIILVIMLILAIGFFAGATCMAFWIVALIL
jgi:hypothetical protein